MNKRKADEAERLRRQGYTRTRRRRLRRGEGTPQDKEAFKIILLKITSNSRYGRLNGANE